jgi:hypothetical protein
MSFSFSTRSTYARVSENWMPTPRARQLSTFCWPA